MKLDVGLKGMAGMARGVIADILFALAMRMEPERFVDDAFRGILPTPADQQGLRVGASRLRDRASYVELLGKLSLSAQGWRLSLQRHSNVLAASLCKGLLGREPDASELHTFSTMLIESGDLSPLVNALSNTDEHWKGIVGSRAPVLVRMLYRGLLDRDADAIALETYATTLAKTRDIIPLLAELAGSDEHWKRSIATRAPQLVQELYKGILLRDADAGGLNRYTKMLGSGRSLAVVVDSILNSDEFSKSKRIKKWPDPALSYGRQAIVFLHLQKTAGSSMWHMLRDVVGQKALYVGYEQRLWNNPPGQLSTYSIFTGHFNYDMLSYIPRENLSVFTFLREPRERLLSLYHYWRSVNLNASSYIGVKLAHELSLQSFLEAPELQNTSDLWNHMTWGVMGQRKWEEWQQKVIAIGRAGLPEEFTSAVRREVRKRLGTFLFVGIQGHFNRSVEILFQLLKQPQPAKIRSENRVRISAEKELIEANAAARLDELSALDNIVYEEGLRLFRRQAAR